MKNSHLLESIIRLTEKRDQHSLEICLIQTLEELIAAKRLQLYECSEASGKLELTLVLDATLDQEGRAVLDSAPEKACLRVDDPVLLDCLKTQQPALYHPEAQETQAIYPIVTKEQIVSVLCVATKTLSSREQELITSFLRIYQNYLLLLSDNERDTLTGLLNRKSFDQRIQRVMCSYTESRRRATDQVEYFGLAVLDIDHFKRVNDQYGHLYGDEVLLLFTRLMRNTFRESDLLFRFGGEEFIVIMKNVDAEKSCAVLDRFRKVVEAFSFPQVGKVTVSIGMAEITDQELPTTIIGKADKALYYAKKNGRNQVHAYEQLVREGKLEDIRHQGTVELF